MKGIEGGSSVSWKYRVSLGQDREVPERKQREVRGSRPVVHIVVEGGEGGVGKTDEESPGLPLHPTPHLHHTASGPVLDRTSPTGSGHRFYGYEGGVSTQDFPGFYDVTDGRDRPDHRCAGPDSYRNPWRW